MAKLNEINGEIRQGIVKVLAHHWRNDEVLNFTGGMDEVRKEYTASVVNEILVHLKWEIEEGAINDIIDI